MFARPLLSLCTRCCFKNACLASRCGPGSWHYRQLQHLHTSPASSSWQRWQQWRQSCQYSSRSLRTQAACNASPPKTVHDIVRRVNRGDVSISFARSGGAGGQNVNKVNTKVDMRLKLDAAVWIPPDLKEKKRINKEGELVVTSTLTRSQADNVEDALQKLQACINAAAETLIPAEIDPEKVKQIAKQKKIANENRLENKKKASAKKQDRRAKVDW